jgi:hypothetical protein
MDQVTRKRFHKVLVKQFDAAVDRIERDAIMPSRAMHPAGVVTLNGVPYQVQVVLEEYRGDDEYEDGEG